MKANLDIVSLAENSHNNFVFYISPNHDAACICDENVFLLDLPVPHQLQLKLNWA